MNRLCLALLLLASAMSAPAAIVREYYVNVNTASIAGVSGSLFFDFNPGFGTVDPGAASVLGFQTDGTLTPPIDATTAVTGTLPGTVSIQNTEQLNFYQQGFTFGTSFQFTLRIAINNTANATAGSNFDLALIDNNLLPLLTDNEQGFLLTIATDQRGRTTVQPFSEAVLVTPIPEPGTWLLLSAGLSGLALLRRRS